MSDLSESLGEILAVNAHGGAQFSCDFHILFISRTLKNSHVETLNL